MILLKKAFSMAYDRMGELNWISVAVAVVPAGLVFLVAGDHLTEYVFEYMILFVVFRFAAMLVCGVAVLGNVLMNHYFHSFRPEQELMSWKQFFVDWSENREKYTVSLGLIRKKDGKKTAEYRIDGFMDYLKFAAFTERMDMEKERKRCEEEKIRMYKKINGKQGRKKENNTQKTAEQKHGGK